MSMRPANSLASGITDHDEAREQGNKDRVREPSAESRFYVRTAVGSREL